MFLWLFFHFSFHPFFSFFFFFLSGSRKWESSCIQLQPGEESWDGGHDGAIARGVVVELKEGYGGELEVLRHRERRTLRELDEVDSVALLGPRDMWGLIRVKLLPEVRAPPRRQRLRHFPFYRQVLPTRAKLVLQLPLQPLVLC